MESPASVFVDRLVCRHGKDGAREIIKGLRGTLTNTELAGLAYAWRRFWARPKQVFPDHDWRSFGFLTARGVGKTTACAGHIVEEVQSGRARCIGLAAQNETKTIAVQVAALIDASLPKQKPEWLATAMQLHWPNGAVAFAFTPEVPAAIRSPNFDLCWLSELQSWPIATRDEAYLNFQFATRIGYARTIWDATPKRRHPMLRALLQRAESDPDHVVVRGTIHENRRNLGPGVIEGLEATFGGTIAGREELLGEMVEDSASALVRQAWIDKTRRPALQTYARKAIGIDPATTTGRGSDTTGIILAAKGHDGQGYVLADLSGKHTAPEWARIVLDTYVREACDLVVVETNKGGGLVVQNLSAAAESRGLRIVKLGKEERPQALPKVVYVREVYATGAKEDRAQPVATAYERGRISHVLGASLTALEDILTTWEPGPSTRSPDELDALVHVMVDLLELAHAHADPKASSKGLAKAVAALQPAARSAGPSMQHLFGTVPGRSRI